MIDSFLGNYNGNLTCFGYYELPPSDSNNWLATTTMASIVQTGVPETSSTSSVTSSMSSAA